MNRTILLSVALALGLAACTDNRSSIEVLSRAAPGDAALCTYAPGGDSLLGTAVYDVTLPPSYAVALYVQNNLVDPKDIAPAATTDAKTWRVESVKIRVNPQSYVDRYGPNPALLGVTGEAVLGADGLGVKPGEQQVYLVDVLSGSIADAIRAAGAGGGQVVLGVTLQGQTLDGAHLDTGEWYMTMNLCSGCLVGTCPAGQTVAVNTCRGFGQLGRFVECKASSSQTP